MINNISAIIYGSENFFIKYFSHFFILYFFKIIKNFYFFLIICNIFIMSSVSIEVIKRKIL